MGLARADAAATVTLVSLKLDRQEAPVAKDLLIVYGYAFISWDDFVRAVQYAINLRVLSFCSVFNDAENN